jgi:hypothetical protein
MTRLYYTPPTDEQFVELKEKAIEVWKENHSNEYGYVDEKVNAIKDIGNISDNFMYMVAMFDVNNQRHLADKLSPETRQSVKERIIDGGEDYSMIF